MDGKYREILRHFASCDLYKYEDIGEPYRKEYIDPVLKKINKSIEQFDIDLQEENRNLMTELDTLARLSQEGKEEYNKIVGGLHKDTGIQIF